MADQIQIFLSSTSEFLEERAKIAGDLPNTMRAYRYETERARGDGTEEWCRKQIQDSKAFVGILGGKYGSPYNPPADKGSIVEWEYDITDDYPDLEVMMYIIKVDEVEPEQQQFIDRISKFKKPRRLWPRPLDRTEGWWLRITNDILKWRDECNQEQIRQQAKVPSELHIYLAPIAISTLGLIALTVILSLVYHYSPIFIYIICGLGVLLLVSTFLLIRSQMVEVDGRTTQ